MQGVDRGWPSREKQNTQCRNWTLPHRSPQSQDAKGSDSEESETVGPYREPQSQDAEHHRRNALR